MHRILVLWIVPAATVLAQSGIQVNVDPDTQLNVKGDAANEPVIAISPLDPDNIVVGWRQFDSVKSAFRRAGVAYSRDGGRTWISDTLAPPPGWDPAKTQQTDPCFGVNAEGDFFFWSEAFDNVSRPMSEFFYPSTDDGETWDTPTVISNENPGGDKPWFIIDRTDGIGHGNIYGAWTWFEDNSYTVVVRSTDNGQSFSPIQRVADNDGDQFMSHLVVGNDGEVFIAWRNYDDNAIWITRSDNARDPEQEPTFDAYGVDGEDGLDVRIADSNDPGFMDINPDGFHQVWLGMDHSGGQYRGQLYCVWAAANVLNDPCDIAFSRSTDGGFTWSEPMRINDDGSQPSYQWMVAMDVAPNGRIDVLWYDTRDNRTKKLSSLYYSYSLDGGQSWSVNRRLSDAFDSKVGFPVQRKIGDYNQIISYNNVVNIVYAATFNGEEDIWFLQTAPRGVLGDMNCDSVVNFDDIDGFVVALIDPLQYQLQYPLCDFHQGDVNRDQSVDFVDIDTFVDCLIHTACP